MRVDPLGELLIALDAWAVWKYSTDGSLGTLMIGILSFLIGFALIGYVFWLVRKLQKADIN